MSKLSSMNIWAAEPGWLSTYASHRVRLMDIPEENRPWKALKDELVSKRPSILDTDSEGNTVIKVHGPITTSGPDLYDLYYDYPGLSYQEFIDAIAVCRDTLDEGDTLVIEFDTPGGDVGTIESAAEALRDAREYLDVRAHVTGMCASAGMWLASQCGHIYGQDVTSLAGSVGVAQMSVDFTKFYNSLGVVIYSLTNTQSPDKRPNIAEEEGRQVYLDFLDEIYEVFITSVVRGRGGACTREGIESLKGRCVLAENAILHGLFDGYIKKGKSTNSDIKNNTKEDFSMDLEQYLKENPEAKAKFDSALAEAHKEGREDAQIAMKERVDQVRPFVEAGVYPVSISVAALNCVAGGRTVDAVRDLVALSDEHRALNESKLAEKDSEETEELRGSNEDLERVKAQKDIDVSVGRVKNLLGV